MAITPPEKGFIFWPVGTGDSITVRIDEDVYMQVDLRHMEKSEDNEDPAWPVVDELIEILPEKDGNPFLSLFVQTHPDEDHCKGFQELIDRVDVSELWVSPRIFREHNNDDDMCDDAVSLYKEAKRRRDETIKAKGDPGEFNRIRIIGQDDVLDKEEFNGFPEDYLHEPGDTLLEVDGEDQSDNFSAFVHAPFEDNSEGDRNECSIGLQVKLFNDNQECSALLLGDLDYPILSKIFDESDSENLSWNVFLSPHHCSKSVMYQRDDEGDEKYKADIMKSIDENALEPGYIISSSTEIPKSNSEGDNPPHVKAKKRYEEIVPDEFLCTHEYPDSDDPQPIILELSDEDFSLVGEKTESTDVKEALKSAGAGGGAATTGTGFGEHA